jgi:hypothetical protein
MNSICPTCMVKLKEVNKNMIKFIMKHIIITNCFICCIMDTTISLFLTMFPINLLLIRLGHQIKMLIFLEVKSNIQLK